MMNAVLSVITGIGLICLIMWGLRRLIGIHVKQRPCEQCGSMIYGDNPCLTCLNGGPSYPNIEKTLSEMKKVTPFTR
jgi:hypothetical protein